MDPTPLLEYAATNRPPYFKPDQDIELYDEEEEEWNALYATPYSLSSLIDELRSRKVETENVRFSEDNARKYLHHLSNTGLEDKLHHEALMNRERLVAFADAGYTTVDDLLGTSDKFDISRDTGVDENVVSSIATNHLGGFSTGSTFGDSGPLDTLSPDDSFSGWTLVEATSYRIRWVSSGRFNLTISPAPEGSTTVAVNTPDAKMSAWYRKGRTVEGARRTHSRPKQPSSTHMSG